MKPHLFFIAGTDTEVGKTTATLALMDAFQQQGLSCVGLKPIASGGIESSDGYNNEDALLLQQKSSLELPYSTINPFSFAPPISPHLAAKEHGIRLNARSVVEKMQAGLSLPTDVILIEGAGGWYAPINEQETMADIAKQLQCPIILVVGLRLGCLNHSLLTWEAITNANLKVSAWIANQGNQTMLVANENRQTLAQHFHPTPYATLPPSSNPTHDLGPYLSALTKLLVKSYTLVTS